MTGTTHQMIALTCALWIATLHPVYLGPVMGVLALFAVMIGALMPDIDQPTANIWKRILGGRAMGDIFRAFSGGHRHITHSLLGIIGVGWALNWAVHNLVHPEYIPQASMLWYAFMIGYVSHPMADTVTDRGVPWLYPLRFHVKIPPGPGSVRVTTGSFVEMVLVRTAVVVIFVLLLVGNWDSVRSMAY